MVKYDPVAVPDRPRANLGIDYCDDTHSELLAGTLKRYQRCWQIMCEPPEVPANAAAATAKLQQIDLPTLPRLPTFELTSKALAKLDQPNLAN